jgi:hypothetical protein
VKKTMFMILCMMVTCSTVAVADDCSVINDAADKAREYYEEVSNEVYDSYVVDKGDSFWDDCLGGILDAGFSFDLSSPSISGIIDDACNYAKSEITDQLNAATADITSGIDADAYGFGVSGSASATSGGSGVSVDDTSAELSNAIWSSIK